MEYNLIVEVLSKRLIDSQNGHVNRFIDTDLVYDENSLSSIDWYNIFGSSTIYIITNEDRTKEDIIRMINTWFASYKTAGYINNYNFPVLLGSCCKSYKSDVFWSQNNNILSIRLLLKYSILSPWVINNKYNTNRHSIWPKIIP